MRFADWFEKRIFIVLLLGYNFFQSKNKVSLCQYK